MEMMSQAEKMEEKLTLADRFMIAMFSPKEYSKILKESVGKLVYFLAILLLLLVVIRYAIPTFGGIAGMGGVKNIILNRIPIFSLENGEFSFEEKIEQADEVNGVYVTVDTDVDKFTEEDIPSNMAEAILISKTNILFYNQVIGMGGLTQENLFSDMKGITFNNELLAKQAPLIYFCLVLILGMLYGVELCKYLFFALIYAIVVGLLAKSLMVEHSFGVVYKTALYAQTIGSIVSAIAYCVNSDLLILASMSFSMLITIIIMNRVLVTKGQRADYL